MVLTEEKVTMTTRDYGVFSRIGAVWLVLPAEQPVIGTWSLA